jgi:hypothetical protein
MPIEKAKILKLIEMMDAFLKNRDQGIAEGTYYDDDEDKDCELAEGNTMPTPTQPFSDGTPEKIHGQPDQEVWPPKARVPVPIATL